MWNNWIQLGQDRGWIIFRIADFSTTTVQYTLSSNWKRSTWKTLSVPVNMMARLWQVSTFHYLPCLYFDCPHSIIACTFSSLCAHLSHSNALHTHHNTMFWRDFEKSGRFPKWFVDEYDRSFYNVRKLTFVS